MRSLVFRFALALAAVAAPVTAALAADCRFEAPPDWSSATSIRWFGPCPGGTADGLGVLRAYLDGAPANGYFGRMNRGQPTFGVLESENGFSAGRIQDGAVIESDDRQDLIDAFELGAKAARATAARFSAEGNTASAKFYADKAGQLERQMD